MSNFNQSQRIARLNDNFRQTFLGGQVQMTAGITTLPEVTQAAILNAVQQFNAFIPDNDPYGEHDFGVIELEGQRIFWKIDYYDLTLTFGSEHPEDANQTRRVLTIMLAEEY